MRFPFRKKSTAQKISDLMEAMMEELAESDSRGARYEKRAAKVAFSLGFNYYRTAESGLRKKWFTNVACGALIRANIENLADMTFFYDDNIQSRNYIELGMNKYAKRLRKAFEVSPSVAATRELMDQIIVNPWAGSTITNPESGEEEFRPVGISRRIRLARHKGYPNLIAVYGFYSFFAHPNPGVTRFRSVRFVKNYKFRVRSMQIDNDVLAIEIMRIVLHFWDLKATSIAELDELMESIPKIGVMHHFVFQNAERGLQAGEL